MWPRPSWNYISSCHNNFSNLLSDKLSFSWWKAPASPCTLFFSAKPVKFFLLFSQTSHTHIFTEHHSNQRNSPNTNTHTHITLIRSIFVLPLLLVNNMIYLAFALFKKVKEIRELVVSILRLWCWAVLFLYQKWKGKANWSSTADGSHQLVFGLPPSSPPSRKQAPWSWHIRITNPAINTNVQCKWS